MMRIIISSFLVILLASTVDAQVASQTTPYLPSLQSNDPSFAPVVVALGCSFLFVVFFTFYLRHCSDANLTVPDRPVAAATTVNYRPHEPQGIDSKLLDTFPILTYSNLKDLKLGGNVPLECAVCLIEFKHDDTLRLLPKCYHAFHTDCIKKWLASHVTCPVCRGVLKPECRYGEEEVTVVIRNETNEAEEVGDGSERRTATTREVGLGERGLRRSHSTGHSLDSEEWRGKDMERYILRLREDVIKKQIMVSDGRIPGSTTTPTNSDVFQGREDEGSSRERLFLSANDISICRQVEKEVGLIVPSQR